MRRTQHERSSPWQVVTWGLARFLIIGTSTLMGLAICPYALGCRSVAVVSGSMSPEVMIGDVLVTRPLGSQLPRRGQVLVVTDPVHPERQVSHRLVRVNADGTLVLKGDANLSSDSTPVQRSAVRGVAILRVPFIGWPSVWAQRGQGLPLAATALMGIGAGTLGRSRTPGRQSRQTRTQVTRPDRRWGEVLQSRRALAQAEAPTTDEFFFVDADVTPVAERRGGRHVRA
jgi:signal peptidase I